MKTIKHILRASCLAFLFTVGLQAAPKVGQPAPDFTLTDLNGKTHTLSAYKGRTVVLEWVNPECPFVRKHYEGSGNMPGTQKAALADGAVWLSINSGRAGGQGDFSPAEVAEWASKTAAEFTGYCRDQDGKVGKLYDARHTPTLFVVNAEGILVYAGGIDDINSANPADIKRANNFVKAALADLKAGQPGAQAVTRAYGCGIKYAN